MTFGGDVVGSIHEVQGTVITLNRIGMDGLVGQIKKVGSLRAALAADKAQGAIGQQVSDVTRNLPQAAVFVEVWIDNLALTWKAHPVVESGAWRGIVAHVPFANEAGRIPGPL